MRVQGCRKGAGLEVLPGLRAFKWLEFTAALDDPDCTIEGRLGLQGFRGPYRLERITVKAGVGMLPGCITGEALRSVSIEEVVNAVLAEHGTEAGEGRRPAHPDWQQAAELEPRTGAQLRGIGAGDRGVLAVVAAVYMAALLSGGNPAESVAARLEASPATAGRYIRAAKKSGLLRTEDRSV